MAWWLVAVFAVFALLSVIANWRYYEFRRLGRQHRDVPLGELIWSFPCAWRVDTIFANGNGFTSSRFDVYTEALVLRAKPFGLARTATYVFPRSVTEVDLSRPGGGFSFRGVFSGDSVLVRSGKVVVAVRAVPIDGLRRCLVDQGWVPSM